VPVWAGSTLHQVRADRHVTATGSVEQPLMFEGNDLPGVMLASGAQRLASLYGVRPGKTAVVATIGDRGLQAALPLHGAGVSVAAVVDSRAEGADEDVVQKIEDAGIRLLRGSSVVKADGRKAVRRAIVAKLDAAGKPLGGERERIECDLIAVSGGTVPASSLLLQAGAKSRWDDEAGAFMPEDV